MSNIGRELARERWVELLDEKVAWLAERDELRGEIARMKEALEMSLNTMDELRYSNSTDIAKEKYYKTIAKIEEVLNK